MTNTAVTANQLPSLLVFISSVALVAVFGAQFEPGAWYSQLQKPDWNPPNWVFGPVIVAYARELDRLEMHVFDGAHLLLETHYRECADAIRPFIVDAATGVPRTDVRGFTGLQ